jgi:hypothetical protein
MHYFSILLDIILPNRLLKERKDNGHDNTVAFK